MLTDWLAREGWIIFNWWLLATLAGAAVFPLCLRFLSGLPDRGYTLARPAGMLIVAFTFWLLAMFGFVENTAGSMVLAWVIVLGVALVVYFTRRDSDEAFDWRGWWRENRSAIIAAELVFAGALIGWSIFRAYQHGILYTEKDMELAFLSSSMRSTTFPPNDPWMAGYAISYYYFGYVIAAMMSTLSGINSTTGFNMNTAMTFALTAVGVFGVVYNLVRSRAFRYRIEYPAEKKPGHGVAISTGLVGVMLVLLMENWQTLLVEIPYRTGTADAAYLSFFNMNERTQPITIPAQGLEEWDRGTYWWWFRSSRVLNDINLQGGREEVIDEFPAFSFILSDNHPHVMSLPYTLLAIGLALNTLLMTRAPRGGHVILYAVVLGGLIFLNTWDGPIYMVGVIAADALRRYLKGGGSALQAGDWLSLAWLGVRIVALSVLLYLPFLIGFRSQLGGILPNVQYPTLFSQFFTQFAPFLIILSMFLGIETWRAGKRFNVQIGLGTAGIVLIGLILLLLVLIAAASIIPSIQSLVLNFVDQNGGWDQLLPALLQKRLTHFLTALVLAIGLFFVAGRLLPRTFAYAEEAKEKDPAWITYPPATGFVLLLVAAGILLTIVPEFVYLRDNFSTRMNTVFKFYYQAWVMWGIASAYALYTILSDHELRVGIPPVRFAFGSLAVLSIAGGVMFTVLAIHSRTWLETDRAFIDPADAPEVTLDGGEAFIRAGRISADDYAAVECLSNLVQGDDAIVVQAVGGSYGWGYGSVGTLTGIPILYNWGGHQSQWRGSTFPMIAGSKEDDIRRLYTDPTWFSARNILLQYGIDYVFFGQNERIAYQADETMFRDNLEIVCDIGSARVYHVDLETLASC